jgi:hypothetical protein
VKTNNKARNPWALLAVMVSALTLQACGGGSGPATTANPVTTTPDVSNYGGPPPGTQDVSDFKLAVWDNLVPNNRCGNCHSSDQSPRFVRADDINLAYDAARTVVDLNDPGMSIMVSKVRGGHNCWLADNDACGDIIESYIANWAGDTATAGTTVELVAPALRDPGASKNFPDDPGLFSTTVYPLLTQYCSNCHTESAAIPQKPYFASPDLAIAYEAAKTKIDLQQPEFSRLVLRLRNEFHNCWDDCAANAAEMEAEITNMADAIPETQVDESLVTSKALGLPDGIISSAGGRFESNAIALYEFKSGTGNSQAFDTSGVNPALDLTLSGGYQWVGGWGVQFIDGKAQGSTTASAKLTDLISATGEFSIETWVAPGNVTQDGPARIVSYAGGSDSRNFMLGQTLYDYDSFVRTEQTNQAGDPQLSTPAAEEVLQATLQHVVLNYDPVNGRQIFVNGQFRSTADPVPGGLLTEWDDTFALAIGSEVDNENRWQGTMRLLAIHNRVLTPEQIQQNFEVGVGEKYFLLFNVSDHVNIADAYVVFEVSQFDSYSYLFDEPFFVVLGSGITLGDIPIQGIRIGENGRELEVGQAFRNVDVNIDDVAYAAEGRQTISNLGTIIPLEQGPDADEFFLTFETLGTASNVFTEPVPLTPPPPAAIPRDPPAGIRDFAEVNATMSLATGISTTEPTVRTTYNAVVQAMPVQPNLAGFISSQQMGITQLAIQYCSALVDDDNARASYWPGFDWSAGLGTAFNNRAAVTDPLIANIVGLNLNTQPDTVSVATEVNNLIDRLLPCSGAECDNRVESIMKGACASVLGSAAMLVQ